MNKMPLIHSICVLKNEADIVELCLRRALEWSAHVILYDGDSTDGTWEIVCRIAKEDPRVIAWKQDGKPFQESLRAEVFNEFRHLASEGDWWCHLDADEVYIDDPRAFLAKVRRPYDVVWGLFVEYYLTQSDVDTLDFQLPIEQIVDRLQHYRIENSEPRFFRHRNRLVWNVNQGWPQHMGLSFPELIRFKHFKYRSPDQIQRRLNTRQSNIQRGFAGWENARSKSWQEKVVCDDRVKTDLGDGVFTPESASIFHAHLEAKWKRVLKFILHAAHVLP